MTSQIVIRSPTESNNRRQPLLPLNTSPLSPCVVLSPAHDKKVNVAECAGGTAAECAAVCCCCPLVLVEFLVLAVYKLPTGICRRIWRKRILRKKLKKSRMMNRQAIRDSARRSSIHCVDSELAKVAPKISIDGSPDVVDLEEEMWERFHNTGFGRSLSQRYF